MEQEHFEEVFSYLGDAIIMVDEDSTVIYCNDAFSLMFGYDDEEIIGKPIDMLMENQLGELHRQYMKNYINSDEPPKTMADRGSIMKCYRKDGDCFSARISIARLHSRERNMGLAIVHDLSHFEEEKQQLEKLARTDGMTLLLNRGYLDEILEDPQTIFAEDEKVGMLFIDLNDFKPVNDQFGHAIGDRMLNIIGLRIKNLVRDSDLAFRYGGDEFLIMVRDVKSPEVLETLAGKIRESISQRLRIEGQELFISCSIGMSLYPRDSDDFTEVLHLADQDMYRNK